MIESQMSNLESYWTFLVLIAFQIVTEFWKINHFVAHETIRIFMFNLVLP